MIAATLGLAFACHPAAAGSDTASHEAPKAVIELFTSQGCSSCPPADRLIGDLSENDDYVVLSLPVDYWDYLGWKDTLASSDNSARQRAYAETRGDRAVYTPQVVVNGRRHVVGSNANGIHTAIRIGGGLPVRVGAHMTADSLAVDIGAAGDATDAAMATVWLVLFDRAKDVVIKRGENRGRTITYHNVVRTMQVVGMWKRKAAVIELPKSEILKSGADGCAVLVQVEDNGRPGPIIGAAYLHGASM
ncbi:DUF1223 domain-containing protein [Breoghania sp. L-A4]|nr:DUF1223 domain-containing protein [Breoghania sp. L-A4]